MSTGTGSVNESSVGPEAVTYLFDASGQFTRPSMLHISGGEIKSRSEAQQALNYIDTTAQVLQICHHLNVAYNVTLYIHIKHVIGIYKFKESPQFA